MRSIYAACSKKNTIVLLNFAILIKLLENKTYFFVLNLYVSKLMTQLFDFYYFLGIIFNNFKSLI